MRIFTFLLIAILFSSCNGRTIDRSAVLTSDEDWALVDFVKQDEINPILEPSEELGFKCPIEKANVNWEARNVFNPCAVIRNDKVHLIYRAQDQNMTSRLGLAVSNDGLHFEKQPAPIFYPDEDSMKIFEWKGGVEDPRIVESEDGRYIMTYTSYDGQVARLCLAISKDLHSWQKHGLVLGQGKFRDTWSKSGAIVSKLIDNRVVATRIDGKYWMYFGDTDLFMATSEDLINWEVLETPDNQGMISVMHPRIGYFDSRLVEPGPFALLRPEGILLIYNGMNATKHNDPTLPKNAYSAGQALFDKKMPYKMIDRMEDHFIHPDKPYEQTGEVNEVCFVEGLVFYKGKWFLYYGTADSRIAVAVK